jgi:hypothetical protein
MSVCINMPRYDGLFIGIINVDFFGLQQARVAQELISNHERIVKIVDMTGLLLKLILYQIRAVFVLKARLSHHDVVKFLILTLG